MRPTRFRLAVWALLVVGPLPVAMAQPAPKMIAHLRADGNYQKDPRGVVKADVKLAPTKDKALLMSGKYAPGEFVTDFRLHVPGLNYASFTVVTRLKLDDSDKDRMAIVYGGEGYRWAGLDRFKSNGRLSVRMNGGRFQKETGVVAKTGEWLTLAMAVDLKARRVTVAVNGGVDEVSLPDGFRLAVLGTDVEKQEKTILFTDFSTGTCLSGLVEELTVYNRAMTRAEMETATRPKAKK
jgi:Concanavalin A-like lectin/glucanases superfamily